MREAAERHPNEMMDPETRQSAVERINHLMRCGYEIESHRSGTFDCIGMRHLDRVRSYVYAYEDGTVVFDKLLATPPIHDRFLADEVDAFNRYIRDIQPPSMWVLLKNGMSQLIAVIAFAAIIFCGTFAVGSAMTLIEFISIQQAWKLGLLAVGLHLAVIAWNTLAQKTGRA